MQIELLQPKDRGKWDEFVNQHSEARFVHTAAYQDILEKTYGYQGYFLYLKNREDEILSIFPFFEFKGWFKKKYVSQPFSEYGGILFKAELSQAEKEEIMRAWQEYLKQFLLEHKTLHLEIRGQLNEPDLVSRYFIKKHLYQVAFLRLDSYQEIYKKFDRQIKKAIKKAEREDVEIFQEASPAAIKNTFYPLYTRYLKKRHGTPPYSLDFFLNCCKYAPQNIKIFFAKKEQTIIAALWGFLTARRIQISYNPSLEKHFLQRPNDFLHAKFIEWACQNHFQYFDFGPASYPGQISYKKKWGATFVDYSYFYFSNQDVCSSPLVPKTKLIKWFSWVWKTIIPQAVADRLGPRIRKKLGR